MTTMLSSLLRLYRVFSPPSPATASTLDNSAKPIKFGILGAANIAPLALVIPAKSHPEVTLHAVAARDISRAEQFAKKHGISKFYGGANGYQELLDDPDIDAVYNPLPNGLHFEWTMKALLAGKHVLLEIPAAHTADETRQMFELAESKGLVLLEAFHYRFHPSIQRVKHILVSGELGKIKSIETTLMVASGLYVKESDKARFNLRLGRGAMMEMGCYTLNCIRYLASADPTEVLSASASAIGDTDNRVDRAMTATLALPDDIVGTLHADLAMPWFGFFGLLPIPPARINATVQCEGGDIHMLNFSSPGFYHTITVTKKGEAKGKRIEKVYKFSDNPDVTKDLKGEDWWLTYRYQLEAFVDRLKGRAPQTWISKEDSVANMEWIEAIHEKAGIGSRPRSEYVVPK